MTIKEAIDYVDKVMPNQYDRKTKIQWLSKLDGLIVEEVFLTHEGYDPEEEFTGYDGLDETIELLVPYPYDEDVYNFFLQAMMNKENGEIVKYNQAISLYNMAMQKHKAWYNRKHTPLPNFTRFVY
jgi:hypothetical protein